MRILVVEDDALLGDAIAVGLRQDGHAVDWVADGVSAVAATQAETYACVVLDVGLPQLSGLEVLKRVREHGNKVPILVLTARDAIADRIAGLDAGADDYLVKPFDMGELRARLRALSRRATGEPAPLLTVGALQMDVTRHEVRYEGQPVELSTREFAVLHALLMNAGRVVTRAQLEEHLYEWGSEVGSNVVEVHVHHLRRKLHPSAVQTIRGVGYMIAKPEAP